LLGLKKILTGEAEALVKKFRAFPEKGGGLENLYVQQ
jgi:hypothetical protein